MLRALRHLSSSAAAQMGMQVPGPFTSSCEHHTNACSALGRDSSERECEVLLHECSHAAQSSGLRHHWSGWHDEALAMIACKAWRPERNACARGRMARYQVGPPPPHQDEGRGQGAQRGGYRCEVRLAHLPAAGNHVNRRGRLHNKRHHHRNGRLAASISEHAQPCAIHRRSTCVPST